MNNVIKAYEVIKGKTYRLFPSAKRSRYLIAECVDVHDGHPIFLYTDSVKKITKVISNVDSLENVQVVFKNG